MGASKESLVQRSHRYWHLIFFALVTAGLLLVIHGLSAVIAPLAGAMLVSYLLDPVVSFLERRLRVPRWLGTLVLFVVALLAVVVVILLVIPVLVRELQAFASDVGDYLRRIRTTVIPWLDQTFGIRVPATLGDLPDELTADVRSVAGKLLGPLSGVAGKVAKGTAGFLSSLSTLLLIPIFVFYFLPKFDQIVASAGKLVPRRYYSVVSETCAEIDRALAAWLRGQLTVMAILAVLYAVGLSLVGVKMAVVIGLTTGMLAFIPYVGFAIGAILALLMCLLEYQGWHQLAGVAAVFVVVQALEGLVLTPYLVGEKVGLGPVGVLVALMLGGALFGFVGVLLAVPTAAALVVVVRRALTAYRESNYYRSGETSSSGGSQSP
jgi:predicted PurR-regulated permease PerM